MNRNSLIFKPFSIVMLFAFLFQMFYPTVSYALTSGPSQPETQGFTPASVTELVDPFSGDFSYNIPLMDVGGYPIGLSYNAGASMDQEASWVGVGWNINPGVITRNVRGLPDDFKGEQVEKTFNLKPNRTYGASALTPIELFGLDLSKKVLGLKVGVGVSYNNYSGTSLDWQIHPSIGGAEGSKSPFTASLGLSIGSGGVGISPSVSFSLRSDETKKNFSQMTTKLGSSFNSRSGLQALTLDASLSEKGSRENKNDKDNPLNATKGQRSLLGGKISFASPTYTPKISNSFVNRSLSLSFSIGGEIYGSNPGAQIQGYYSVQGLRDNTTITPSYGYLYHQEGVRTDNAVLDFNREKDVGYSKEVKNLPVTSATYDVFSVSGEGVGGSYRLFRNDVGTVYDNFNTNTSGGLSLGGPEFGVGALAKGGVNVNVNATNSYTGKWQSGNSTFPILKFHEVKKSEIAEPVYFRKSGEKNVMSNESFFNKFGGFDAIAFDLSPNTELLSAKRTFRTSKGKSGGIARSHSESLNTKRQARNEAIIHYTSEEAIKFGMFDRIREYDADNFDLNNDGTYPHQFLIDRYIEAEQALVTKRKKHHISEINVFSADGKRYVYSDPIYNWIKKEVTFATNNNGTNQVSYTGQDNSKNNSNGLDNYYDRVITPAYPTAFLLSAIVSSDFIDIDGIKGPSDEDLGTYTKFNYSKVDSYKWRTPFDQGQASFNEGFKTKGGVKGDNKANYVYGEKEVKYLHSIETKTHVAEFILSDAGVRDDGYGVYGETGGGIKSNSGLKKLDKIKLYAKEDKLENPTTAIPIKTVHFEYYPNNHSQQLCKGIDNGTSGGGKLTLKGVHFTYGNSNRGKLSPYIFEYSDFNGARVLANYDVKGSDRWGNYQPNTGVVKNDEYPYTDQSKISAAGAFQADQNAAAWNLSKITLPSGGVITVDYEADDYAYVQDKKAMQMFKVACFSQNGSTCSSTPETSSNALYGSNSYDFIKLEIPTNYPSITDWKTLFYDKGKRIDNLYFKMLVNVDKGNSANGRSKKEYVTGYAEVDYSNAQYPQIQGNQIIVKVKEVNEGTGFNPVTFSTFNMMKKNFPANVYNQSPPNGSAVRQIMEALISAGPALSQFVTGVDNSLRNREMGKYIDPQKSWVRLYNPIGQKKGGGHRVKKITIDDQWSTMAKGNHIDAQYGQEYEYTMQDENGTTISSGIAAYEPILGNEENPFRQPRFAKKKNLLVPDERYFTEEPMGEMYFPGASVGYRKVTVKNLQYTNVNKNATGKTVHEFYTAYDFPTRLEEVPLRMAPRRTNPVLKLFKLGAKDFLSTSQGYVVELNDMHGKQKAKWEFQENDEAPYSGVEYKYKQRSEKQIASRDLVIDKTGSISEQYLGVEMDLVADARQSFTAATSGGAEFNLDGFVLLIVPVTVPLLWPNYSREVTRYSTIVMSKVVKRHGLLKETIYYDQKSMIGKTKNLIRDAESGEVLLTQSENEFGDPIYNFNYPAYWAYDHMGPVYKSLDMSIELSKGAVINQYLELGDRVAINKGTAIEEAWVAKVDGTNSSFIDENGIAITTALTDVIRIVDPARTNQQMQKVGSVITKRNPAQDLNGDGIPERLVFDEVLQATTTEFTEQASVFCNCKEQTNGIPFNPFVKGTKGIWKPWREFNYLTDRVQSRRNENIDTRTDGSFYEFSPFWTANPVAGKDWQPNYEQWIYTAEATTFNPYGKELESRDALGRYSSALFGYNHALPTAVAKNARYQHIAFDGFEDYGTEDCGDDHFSYEQIPEAEITDQEAHSGEKSIKVSPSTSKVVLRKVMIECDK